MQSSAYQQRCITVQYPMQNKATQDTEAANEGNTH